MVSASSFDSLARRLRVPGDGNIELTALINPDIEPMPASRRNWGFWSFFGYWGVPNMTIWTWSTGSALVTLGLPFSHIMGAITLGNLVICFYTCFISQPGTKYAIGYPISQRVVFGIRGSWLPILIRVVLSVVFYGSQSWLGGELVVVVLSGLSKLYMEMGNTLLPSVAMTTRDFVGFLIFLLIQLVFLGMNPEKINKWLVAACSLTFVAFLAMLGTCIHSYGSNLGPIFHYNPSVNSETGWLWLYAITIWYGALSPDITNHNDYSRYASSLHRMNWGIVAAIFTTGTFAPLAGLICASVTKGEYGVALWLPTDILLHWLKADYSAKNRAMAVIFGTIFALSQMTFNVAANGLAGGMEIAGLCPKYVSIARGAFFTAIVSWAVQPWNFYNSSSIFLTVMGSFGTFTTPIIAISIADYAVVRKATLPLHELYTDVKTGTFYYWHGVNMRAFVVWLLSVVFALPGLVATISECGVPLGFVRFYQANAIFAFVCPFVLYLGVCWVYPPALGAPDLVDYFGVFSKTERAKLGMEQDCEEIISEDLLLR